MGEARNLSIAQRLLEESVYRYIAKIKTDLMASDMARKRGKTILELP